MHWQLRLIDVVPAVSDLQQELHNGIYNREIGSLKHRVCRICSLE